MTDEEMVLLGQIRSKVKKQPEFLEHIISAGVQGTIDRGKYYQQMAMAMDMETLASTAIIMTGEKRITKKTKEKFETLALNKLDKYLPDQTFFKWDWALEKKDGTKD